MAESEWIPREEFVMPEGAQETWLGSPKGSLKQYRAGRLHIREYPDCFEVHEDEVDPRQDPIGHLIKDAPVYLAGFSALIAVAAAATRHPKLAGAAGIAAAGFYARHLAKGG